MLTFTDNFENDKELILRDHLALERTKLANERTLFAYIRMALYLLTVGIGIFQIESISRLDGLAWGCIIAGIFLFFLGFVRFEQMRKHLKQYTKTCRDTENYSIGLSSCISMVLVATAYSSGKILPPISFAHALVNSAPVYMMMEE